MKIETKDFQDFARIALLARLQRPMSATAAIYQAWKSDKNLSASSLCINEKPIFLPNKDNIIVKQIWNWPFISNFQNSNMPHTVRNLYLCPKIQLWFSVKIFRFFGWKTCENVVILDFLAVDNFDFTRKKKKKKFGEKLVKMLWFCQNWIFGQKFDFSYSVAQWKSFVLHVKTTKKTKIFCSIPFDIYS